ncbi:MAG: MBL fold metallo-hydrolase [Haloarculaceae archaeon]
MEASRELSDGSSGHRIEFEVDWPPGHVAAYLIDGEEPVLVDTGMTGDGAREHLLAGLDDAGYELADIEHLVVTHPHVDHVGQVPTVLEAADPTFWAPATARERLRRDVDELEVEVRENATAAGLRGQYLEGAVDMSVESLERDRDLLPVDAVDHWIEGGETVTIADWDVRPVHTPGHQADHLCYLTEVGDERVLFSGDMALSTFRPVAMHDGLADGYTEAIDAYYTALDRLDELSVDRVFTGHDPVHTEFQAAVEHDRGSLDHLLERTRDSLDPDEGKTAIDVAFERSGDRDIRYLVIETMSALAKLEADGEIEGVTDEHGARQFTRSA